MEKYDAGYNKNDDASNDGPKIASGISNQNNQQSNATTGDTKHTAYQSAIGKVRGIWKNTFTANKIMAGSADIR